MEELCPADTSIHGTLSLLNVTSAHQPSLQNKGKTSSPKMQQEGQTGSQL